ncbi:ankyrin [Zychaea mexicana]|uniref:ankyrin n=1 Tax=Zychaea mexicana TaxID=64656 RepID=UPI0022FE5CFE|nr:ankyrin [Zychaea mexicana]KAI9496320.1 ankyrin [Zychaea mexicana]
MENEEGASNNERMLAACRNDQDDLLKEILKATDIDVNFSDAIGDTTLHYAASFGSLACLEILVNLDGINLNARNRIEKNTPLHKAVQYTEEDVALATVDLLLEAGADPRIENGNRMTPAMLVDPKNDDMKELFDNALAGYEVDDSDIAEDYADEGDVGAAGEYNSDDYEQ